MKDLKAAITAGELLSAEALEVLQRDVTWGLGFRV